MRESRRFVVRADVHERGQCLPGEAERELLDPCRSAKAEPSRRISGCLRGHSSTESAPGSHTLLSQPEGSSWSSAWRCGSGPDGPTAPRGFSSRRTSSAASCCSRCIRRPRSSLSRWCSVRDARALRPGPDGQGSRTRIGVWAGAPTEIRRAEEETAVAFRPRQIGRLNCGLNRCGRLRPE
jgi:hypothetical protein